MTERESPLYGDAPIAVTAAEAAWLTELSAKTVNASIDRGELGKRPRKRSFARGVRRLGEAEVVYLVLRKELADVLSASAKRELYDRILQLQASGCSLLDDSRSSRPKFDIALAGGVLRIESRDAIRRLARRWTALRKAAELVVSDADIRGGEPVIRGTRIPVYMIADLIDQGADLNELLEDYPALNADKIRSALAYAQTHPRRGRPRAASAAVSTSRRAVGR